MQSGCKCRKGRIRSGSRCRLQLCTRGRSAQSASRTAGIEQGNTPDHADGNAGTKGFRQQNGTPRHRGRSDREEHLPATVRTRFDRSVEGLLLRMINSAAGRFDPREMERAVGMLAAPPAADVYVARRMHAPAGQHLERRPAPRQDVEKQHQHRPAHTRYSARFPHRSQSFIRTGSAAARSTPAQHPHLLPKRRAPCIAHAPLMSERGPVRFSRPKLGNYSQ